MEKPPYFRPVIHNQNRNSNGRDYTLPGMYYYTLNKTAATPILSTLHQHANGTVFARSSEIGLIVTGVLANFAEIHPDIHISKYIIMPEHVHILVWVKARLPKHLGSYIGLFKTRCTQALRQLHSHLQDHSFFEPGPDNNRLVFRPGQLDKVKAYTTDNPRRRWIKNHHPRLFTQRHSVTIGDSQWYGIGNIFLLNHFDIYSVRVSSKFSEEELKKRQAEWDYAIREKKILAGLFYSPKEKEVMRKAIEKETQIILFMDRPFPDRFKPSGKWFDYCSKGILLILAPAAPFPDAWPQRQICLHINDIADHLAAHSARVEGLS